MTEPSVPSEPGVQPVPPTPGVPPVPPAPSATPSLASFSAPSRLVLGGAAVLLIAAVLGIALDVWRLDQYGLILIVIALVAAGAAWLTEAGSAAGARLPLPTLRLAAGAVGSVLALLALVELLFDLDDLDDRGGIVGLALAVVVAAAALAILLGALQGDPEARTRLRDSDMGTNVAVLGAGLILLAWLLHVTIGFWAFGPAAWGIAAVVLAVIVLVFRDEIGTPFPAAWISVGLAVFTVWVAFGQWNALMDIGATRLELGLDDFLPFLVYVVGIACVLGGSLLVAMAGMRAASGPQADR
jgi:hypothetical protein